MEQGFMGQLLKEKENVIPYEEKGQKNVNII